ncbi:MAG: hypothetical protein ACP5HM_09480 [Anaerolineae bacterium]
MIRHTRKSLLWIGTLALLCAVVVVWNGGGRATRVEAQRPTPTNVPPETEEPRPSPTEPPTATPEPPTVTPEPPTATPVPQEPEPPPPPPQPGGEQAEPTETATVTPTVVVNGERLPLTGVGASLMLVGLVLLMVVLIVRPLRKRLQERR